jgi:hypothetical protein
LGSFETIIHVCHKKIVVPDDSRVAQLEGSCFMDSAGHLQFGSFLVPWKPFPPFKFESLRDFAI